MKEKILHFILICIFLWFGFFFFRFFLFYFFIFRYDNSFYYYRQRFLNTPLPPRGGGGSYGAYGNGGGNNYGSVGGYNDGSRGGYSDGGRGGYYGGGGGGGYEDRNWYYQPVDRYEDRQRYGTGGGDYRDYGMDNNR